MGYQCAMDGYNYDNVGAHAAEHHADEWENASAIDRRVLVSQIMGSAWLRLDDLVPDERDTWRVTEVKPKDQYL